MHSRLASAARAALFGCVFFAFAARAEIQPLPAVQELEPTDAEVLPTPDELVPVGFGTDIAIEGQRALISLPNADRGAGRIAIFQRAASGEWRRTGRLPFASKPDGVSAVELRGGIAVVASNERVYVFRPGAKGRWQHVRTFKVDAGELIFDLKYDGATAVVGTRFGASGEAAYVFQIDRYRAVRRQKLYSPTGASADEYATSVAVFGDTLLVGAPGFNNGQGAVHVYQRRGLRWVRAQTLIASGGKDGDRFGMSVAMRHNLIVVGAPGADPHYGGEFGELQRVGAAFVFAPHFGRWAQSQKVRPSNEGVDTFTSFGTHVEANATHVVIGAPGLSGLTFDGGALFVYERHGRTLRGLYEAVESNELGYAFAIDEHTVIAGIVEPTFYTGRAVVYDLDVP